MSLISRVDAAKGRIRGLDHKSEPSQTKVQSGRTLNTNTKLYNSNNCPNFSKNPNCTAISRGVKYILFEPTKRRKLLIAIVTENLPSVRAEAKSGGSQARRTIIYETNTKNITILNVQKICHVENSGGKQGALGECHYFAEEQV